MINVILQFLIQILMLLSIMFGLRMRMLHRGMPDIQWMNLDPVKLMEELSQFTSLEGFREMLDKAQVRHIKHDNIFAL